MAWDYLEKIRLTNNTHKNDMKFKKFRMIIKMLKVKIKDTNSCTFLI